MMLFLFSIFAFRVHTPPVIDGRLEGVWKTADPITGFTQTEPDEGKPATERTYVYVLSDEKNLYVAFDCRTGKRKPQIRIRGWDNAQGDEVSVYLDTFGDKRSAYFFNVSAAGTQEDGIITRGGISFDDSWDGVWFAATSYSDTGYVVEIKIPLRSIRYAENSTWNIQFRREIPTRDETDYYSPVKRFPGFRISTFVPLEGIEPEVKGRFLEIYPVGIVRYSDRFVLDGGIDISYNPVSAFGFNLTVNPDFAQIEADPFQVNLSKYAIYLSERRPFFLEGQELFILRTGGEMNIGPGPIRVLYTRNIGKVVGDTIGDTTEVPIRLGLKSIFKIKGSEGALMFVNTGAALDEPSANFYAMRLSKDILGVTQGITYTGKEYSSGRTRVMTIDGSYVSGTDEIVYQVSYGDSSGTSGTAYYLNYKRMSQDLLASFYSRNISDGYRIGEVGYLGQKGLNTGGSIGKMLINIGPFRSIGGGIGFGVSREVYLENLSKIGFLYVFLNTKNNWGFSMHLSGGEAWEDTSEYEFKYVSKGSGMNMNSDWSKPIAFNINMNLDYGFNWNAYHMGYMVNGSVYLMFKPSPSIGVGISNRVTGWYSENTEISGLLRKSQLEDLYYTFSPEVNVYLTTKLNLSLNGEAVWEMDPGKVIEYRLNPMVSYNVSPKSWVYLVSVMDKYLSGDDYVTLDRGSVFKIRYLYYF